MIIISNKCNVYLKDILLLGKAVLEDIARKTGNHNLKMKHLDFGNLKTVVTFSQEIIETENKVDVLINNAG